jgi:uncharacterized membrane-anchored protein
MHGPYQITARARILAQNSSRQRTALNYAIKKRTRDSNLLPSKYFKSNRNKKQTKNEETRFEQIALDSQKLGWIDMTDSEFDGKLNRSSSPAAHICILEKEKKSKRGWIEEEK